MIAALLIAAIADAPARESDAEAEANRVAHDHVLCRKYGYDEGSPELAHCLDVLAQRRADARADAAARRREESSRQRANLEKSACDTRSQAINGGGRSAANPHEVGVGTCAR